MTLFSFAYVKDKARMGNEDLRLLFLHPVLSSERQHLVLVFLDLQDSLNSMVSTTAIVYKDLPSCWSQCLWVSGPCRNPWKVKQGCLPDDALSVTSSPYMIYFGIRLSFIWCTGPSMLQESVCSSPAVLTTLSLQVMPRIH